MSGRRNFTEDDLKKFEANVSGNKIVKVPPKKENKYGNRKTLVDGIAFDSKKESNRYMELKMLLIHGDISNLQMQQEFELKVNDDLICKYVADFTYVNHKKEFVVEDVKSEATRKIRTYSIKRKLMKALFGIIISEK